MVHLLVQALGGFPTGNLVGGEASSHDVQVRPLDGSLEGVDSGRGAPWVLFFEFFENLHCQATVKAAVDLLGFRAEAGVGAEK